MCRCRRVLRQHLSRAIQPTGIFCLEHALVPFVNIHQVLFLHKFFGRGQEQSGNYSLGYDWLSAEGVYAGLESLSQTSEESPSYISDQTVNILV